MAHVNVKNAVAPVKKTEVKKSEPAAKPKAAPAKTTKK